MLLGLRAARFTVSAQLEQFWPTEAWQQAGIIVCEDEEFNDYVRLTASASAGKHIVAGVIERGGQAKPKSVVIRNSVQTPFMNLMLRIARDGSAWRCEFRFPQDESWTTVLADDIRRPDVELEPNFAGLLAFRGNVYLGTGLPSLTRRA